MNENDDHKKTLDELISRSLAYRTGPELKALVEFSRRFPHMAPYNAMLLHVQNPGIRYALRARDWESDYERKIRPAARPYVTLAFMGPVAFVFDLSDTEPIDPDWDQIPESVRNPFPAKGAPPTGILETITKNARELGIAVETKDFGTQLAGCVQRWNNPSNDFHLSLNSKHSSAQQFGTLAHELGHVFCGHLGKTKAGFWKDRIGKPLATRELEAEAVAYFVADRMSLDIGSDAYLSGYLTSAAPLPDYSLEAVLKAVRTIEEMTSSGFKVRKKS